MRQRVTTLEAYLTKVGREHLYELVSFFSRPHLWHVEVSGPEVKSELQLQATAKATATATPIWAASATYAMDCSNA